MSISTRVTSFEVLLAMSPGLRLSIFRIVAWIWCQADMSDVGAVANVLRSAYGVFFITDYWSKMDGG